MTATLPATNPADVAHLEHTLLEVIRDAIRDHPRSQQTRIGLSEIGHPCDRWISHKLANTPVVNDRGAPWLPTIGTAVHSWLEDAFDADNVRRIQQGRDIADGHPGRRRWLLEQKVTAGRLTGHGDIDGSTDLYDTLSATVNDWKVVGKTNLDKYRRHGPGTQYRTQVHVNGRGWRNRGLPVAHVAVMFLPRNGELDQSVFWHELYDEQVAVAAFARGEAIGLANQVMGAAAHAAMTTTDHNCGFCPWFRINATDLTKECPGDPSRPKSNDSIYQLVAGSTGNQATKAGTR